MKLLEVIGEASKRLGPEFTKEHPHVPWRQMARMRDKLIHHYDRVSLGVLWETVTVGIPALREAVEMMMQTEGLRNFSGPVDPQATTPIKGCLPNPKGEERNQRFTA